MDGFQGREVDILLLSTVRAANPCLPTIGVSSSSIGFVADIRRMNVALTRAKLSLWILGNARTLQTNHSWAALIEDAKARNLVVPVKMPYKFMLETDPQTSDAQTCGSEATETNHDKNMRSNSRNDQSSDRDKHESSSREYGLWNRRKEDVKQSQSSKMNLGSVVMIDNIVPVLSKKRGMFRKTRGKLQTWEEYVDGSCGNKSVRNEKLAGNFGQVGNASGDIYAHPEEYASVKAAKLTDPSRSGKNLAGSRCSGKQNLENATKTTGSSRSGRKLAIAISSSQSTTEETRAKVDAKCPSLVGKKNNLISERKQQREAVDALLSSALIPSKKRDADVKAVLPKRPLPTTSNASQDIQPVKRVKGKTVLTVLLVF